MKSLFTTTLLWLYLTAICQADIIGQNYKGVPNPEVGSETVFVDCNFAQPMPKVDPNGVVTGVRLFPGDDTPKTFVHCRLVNCELPPGSTTERCGVTLVMSNTIIATRTYTIDGVGLTLDVIGIVVVKNGVTKTVGVIPPELSPIDTTANQYIQLQTAVDLLKTQTAQKIKVYEFLPKAKRIQFLQRDPLFKETLRLVLLCADLINELQEAEND